ncbi:MAG: hypothetical protein WAJ85_02070 [Candidatus Baltobacteraceae bacterium]
MIGALYQLFGPSLGQIIFLWLCLAAAWQGLYTCSRFLGFGRLGAALGAAAYIFNPYNAIQAGNFITGTALLAITPWLTLVPLIGSRFPRSRAALSIAIACAAAALVPIAGGTLQLLYALVLCVGAWTIGACVWASDKKAFALWACTAALISAVCAAWWLVPELLGYLLNPLSRPPDPHSFEWVFARSSIANLLRFNPMWTWSYPNIYVPFANQIDGNPLLTAAQWALSLGALSALFITRRKHQPPVRLAVAIGLAMLFVAKGPHGPLESLNLLLYKLPGMLLFLEPAGPLYVAMFCFAIAFSAAVGESLRRLPQSTLAHVGLSSGVALAIVLSGWPLISGETFRSYTLQLPSEYIRVPVDWAPRHIGGDSASGAVLVLPPDDFYQQRYLWGYTGVDVLPQFSYKRPVWVAGWTGSYINLPPATARISALVLALSTKGSNELYPVLKDLGCRFVVYRSDLVTPAPSGPSLEDVSRALAGAQVTRVGRLTVFDLGPATPEIQESSQWFWSKDGANVAAELDLGHLVLHGAPIFQYSSNLSAPVSGASGFVATAPRGGRHVGTGQSQPRDLLGSFSSDGAASDNTPTTTEADYKPTARREGEALRGTRPLLSAVPTWDFSASCGGSVTVFNPSTETRDVDIETGVAARQPTTYVAALASAVRTASTSAADFPTSVLFKDFQVRPGPSALQIRCNPQIADYLPYHRPTTVGTTWGRLPGHTSILILNILHRPTASPSVAASRVLVYRIAEPLGAVQAIGFKSHSTEPLGENNASMIVRYDGIRYVCRDAPLPAEGTDISVTFDNCLRQNRIIPAPAYLRTAMLEALLVDGPRTAAAFRSNAALLAVTLSSRVGTGRLVMLQRISGQRAPFNARRFVGDAQPRVAPLPFGFFLVSPQGAGRGRDEGDAALWLSQTFSASWLALGISPHALPHELPHLLANGWANGWIVKQNQTVVVMNLLNATQILCALGGLITLFALFLRYALRYVTR